MKSGAEAFERKHGLADAQSVCINGTTLQANASMKSLVRRDTGVSYDDHLRQLAEAEGIENATKEHPNDHSRALRS